MSAKRLPAASVPALFCSALLCSASLPAAAGLNANLGLTSEFIREGISQTDGAPTWQTGLTWEHNSGFYLGGWASGLDRKYDKARAEADVFAGFYQPLSDNTALSLTATHFTFHGDNSDEQDYSELGARLLVDDSWVFGWRQSDDYLGSDSARRAIEASYTLHTGSFAIEFYGAHYHNLDETANLGYNDYLHLRIGLERTWNQWDYRLTLERTNLDDNFDAGTLIQLGVHRYFNLW